MSNKDYAARFVSRLGLDIAPVALAFADAAPSGVRQAAAAVPSACAFWRQAEREVFFAPAAGHFNCPVGAMVMGFDLPQEVSDELMGLVGTMTQCGYISAEEPGCIPTSGRKGAKGIVYGPLADFPIAPDAVLLWATPQQAMILNETVGGAAWTDSGPRALFGRPACAAIPKALGDGKATLSLGCVGMRTFTGIAADRLLAVIPGSAIAATAESLVRMRDVNDRMEGFYRERAASLAAAPGQ